MEGTGSEDSTWVSGTLMVIASEWCLLDFQMEMSAANLGYLSGVPKRVGLEMQF